MPQKPTVDLLDNFTRFERTERSLASKQMRFEFVNRIFYFKSADDTRLLAIKPGTKQYLAD